jgi:ATP-dependent Lon protease
VAPYDVYALRISNTVPVVVSVSQGTGRVQPVGGIRGLAAESCVVAATFVDTNLARLKGVLKPLVQREGRWGTRRLFTREEDLHVSMVLSDDVKDGPSATATLALAILQLVGLPLPQLTAITGTMDLRGIIGMVSEIQGKVDSARRGEVSAP